jgi:hypothetical protein
VPAGALLDGAREPYDGEATVALDVLVSQDRAFEGDGTLRPNLDLASLPTSAAGPFLSPTGSGGATEHAVPVSAVDLDIRDPSGNALQVDGSKPATLQMGVPEVAAKLDRHDSAVLFSDADSFGDEVESGTCAQGDASDTCPSRNTGVLSTVVDPAMALACTAVRELRLSVPEGVEVLERNHQLFALLPNGQKAPVGTRFTNGDAGLGLYGVHEPFAAMLETRVVLRDPEADVTRGVRAMMAVGSVSLDVSSSWTSVSDAEAACADLAVDAGTVVVAFEEPFARAEGGEEIEPPAPDPVTDCDALCNRVDECLG